MLGFQAAGAMVFEYGNNLRAQAREAGVQNAFEIGNFMTRFIRPFFFEGRGPFRWVAISGDPRDIALIDELVLNEFPDDPFASRWVELARQVHPVRGAARAHLLAEARPASAVGRCG